MKRLFITGRNVRLTKPIKNFIKTELSKHQRVAKKYTYLKVEILKEGSSLDDIRIKISMSIESKYIKVEQRGKNFYSLFNNLQKSLFEEILKLKEIQIRKDRVQAIQS
ncbi:HPF/RaiA family ribosome-associated protein [Candidatus Dojkabacteria bacterium]|nr:HPF/RaiA family ribosome-associated protein [Candidatus Dojkabacteria bacterium]